MWKGLLECPWHHFQYDLATGENIYPKRVYPLDVRPRLRRQVRRLRTYPIRERDAYIEVGVSTAKGLLNKGAARPSTGSG